jgi:Lon protease-like protein
MPALPPVIKTFLPAIVTSGHNGSMPDELLPLFPLGLVLFPHTRLPLHIFEDRYKEMVGEAIDLNSEFGIVLAVERGLVNTGCTARVARVVERYEDGRLDIVVAGQRRFEIEALDQERSFLRGNVEFFEDELSEGRPDLRRRATEAYQDAFPGEQEFAVDFSEELLSFQLAQALPDLSAKQTLLQMRNEDDRLRRLIELLPELKGKQEITERMRTLAPRNGHGKHLK